MASSVKVNGPLMRELREKRGYDRPEFAPLVGLSANRIYKIEQVTHSTRPLTLRRIAAVLGVPPEDLAA